MPAPMQPGALPQVARETALDVAVPVVVVHEHVKEPLKVLLVQNQQAVETFRAGGAHEPLGNPAGLWRAKRRTNDLNPVASEHVVKTVGEFLIPIANQKSHRSERPAKVHDSCRACWMTHGALGFGVQPATCTSRQPNSMKKRT
jgi:hypothetical protein